MEKEGYLIGKIPAGATITISDEGAIEATHKDGTFETFQLVADDRHGLIVRHCVTQLAPDFTISVGVYRDEYLTEKF